ncbi:MAG: response regulator [Candidatus Latescibacteria bacterium]|nr:response regulator [Candidatus Latescibacterota bacterium]
MAARGPGEQGVNAPQAAGKAILVIDDQPIARSTLRRQLEYYGFAVLEGATAIEGLRLFYQERARIGLVLLDLGLPDLSGEETFARLRKLDPQVKVALCSEEAATEVKAQEAFQGALGVIKKPVRTDRLLAVVRKALG